MDPEKKQLPRPQWLEWSATENHFALQATGTTLDRGYKLEVLTGLLMIGHLDIDPEGKHLNGSIPKIPIGLGNGAHLATIDLRCIPGGLHD